MGYAVICPHKNTALYDGLCDDKIWLEGDIEILSRCDLMVTVPGWEMSEGCKKEFAFAMASFIPVYHWPDDKQKLFPISESACK